MLDLTPTRSIEREAIVINPAKTCQPVGAMYAALGIHKCLPHSHGSQGCCAYHRKFLTRNFKDPIMASTSSFTEGAAVFGGGANLKNSIKNVFSIYEPDMIAIHTTCLSETIGDDIPSILGQIDLPEGKYVIHANTPSYQGSHITGYANMVAGIVKYLSKNTGKSNNKINIIPGFINPADIREIKRIQKLMDIDSIVFPDTSNVVDTPLNGNYYMYPKGGTKIEDIIDAGNSLNTIALGQFASTNGALEMERKCKVPEIILKTPIGIEATDKFILTLSQISGNKVTEELEDERGRLVDLMVDSHYHYYGKKVALLGDPDILISLTEFLISLGMEPVYIVTGTPGDRFEKEIKSILNKANIEAKVKAAGDLFTLHQWIKQDKVDLLMGGTHGKYIAKAEDIPFVRIGFPILDRSTHAYLPITGYMGAIRIIEMISNSLLDKIDREASDEDVELIM